MFISDIKSYVPIKLCKTSGSIHLFKLNGSVNKENITIHKNTIWDVIEIDWRPVMITLNGNIINLPGSVIIPFRDKFKIRQDNEKYTFVVASNAKTRANLVSLI